MLEGLKQHNHNMLKESAARMESIECLSREIIINDQRGMKERIALDAANLDVRQS